MPVHFAAARSTAHSPIARALARKALARAANDNGDGTTEATFDHVMRGALRHFAEHGLGAAQTARALAEDAHRTGDREAFDWWLGVCRALDRGLAAKVEKKIARATALIY